MNGALLEAVSIGDLERLEHLLTQNQPTEEIVNDLLAAAAGNYQLPVEPRLHIIEFLLTHHPPAQVPESALLKATLSGIIPLFAVFLTKYDASSIVNIHLERHGTPLAIACAFRKPVAFVAFLLEHGADPNYAGEEDWVALPLASVAAVWRDDAAEAVAAVDMLLKYGADGVKNALQTARKRRNDVVERRLLKQSQ